MEKELTDFLEWYWDEIDGKPYQTTALEIVEDYLITQENPFQNDIIDAYDETI